VKADPVKLSEVMQSGAKQHFRQKVQRMFC